MRGLPQGTRLSGLSVEQLCLAARVWNTLCDMATVVEEHPCAFSEEEYARYLEQYFRGIDLWLKRMDAVPVGGGEKWDKRRTEA